MLASECRCVWGRLNFYQRPECYGKDSRITETWRITAGNYIFKVNNRNTRTGVKYVEQSLQLRHQNDTTGVVLVSLLLTCLQSCLLSTLHYIFHLLVGKDAIFHEQLVNCFANYQTRFFKAKKILSRVVLLLNSVLFQIL